MKNALLVAASVLLIGTFGCVKPGPVEFQKDLQERLIVRFGTST